MAHPLNATEFEATYLADMCPWMRAYLLIRAVILEEKQAATPAKFLGGAFTVAESNLAQELGVPLTSIYGLIQADHKRINTRKDAKDEAATPDAG